MSLKITLERAETLKHQIISRTGLVNTAGVLTLILTQISNTETFYSFLVILEHFYWPGLYKLLDQ